MSPDLFDRTDWPALAQQSAALVELRALLNPQHPIARALCGVLHFLDAVGDEAQKRGYTLPIETAPLQSALPVMTLHLPVLFCPDQENVIDSNAYPTPQMAATALAELARDHEANLDELLPHGTSEPLVTLQQLYMKGQLPFSAELKDIEVFIPTQADFPLTSSAVVHG